MDKETKTPSSRSRSTGRIRQEGTGNRRKTEAGILWTDPAAGIIDMGRFRWKTKWKFFFHYKNLAFIIILGSLTACTTTEVQDEDKDSNGQPKWTPNLEFTKFEFSVKFQFLSSSFLFQIMQIESANHAESTGDVQEKPAHIYELEFAPN